MKFTFLWHIVMLSSLFMAFQRGCYIYLDLLQMLLAFSGQIIISIITPFL